MYATRILFFLHIMATRILYIECQCDSAKIPLLGIRSRINEPSPSSLDDSNLSSGWYSALFEGDTYRIPDSTKIPRLSSCGAHYPIYISGLHPDVDTLTETSVSLSGCVKSEFSDCDTKLDIQIRKCNGGIQYHLLPTEYPYSSYCFDPPALQDADATDFEEAPKNVRVEKAEIITSLEHINRLPKIMIDCDVKTEGDTTNLLFDTYWYVNNEFFVSFTTSETTATFEEDQLKLSGLGINISCSVGLKKSPLGKTTEFVSSANYFAGIEVLTPEVHLEKSGKAIVRLRNTLPFGIRDKIIRDPSVRSVQMAYDEEACTVNSDDILATVEADQKACGTGFKALYPFDEWLPETVTMDIASKDINEQDRGRYVLQLQVQKSIEHPVWDNYKLKDISVIVHDNKDYKHAFCRSTNDPHMTTSDGYPFEHQCAGEFVLYRNKKYPIEVQMKTKLCNRNRAYCTCAVAVRAGGDVFLVNHCDLSKRINTMTSCLDDGLLDITRMDEHKIEINTPIGTKISITLWKNTGLMNMAIKMSPKDEGNIEGLCGNFDGVRSNDLVGSNGKTYKITHNLRNYHAAFSESWRVTGMNYFNHDKGCLDGVETWEEKRASLYCTCSCLHQEGVCEEKIPYCSPSQYLSCPNYNSEKVKDKCKSWKTKCTGNRRKRQTEINALLSYEMPVRQKREAINYTEADAEELCRKAIDNQEAVADIGEAALGFNITQAIADCVFDTVEGQSDEWVVDYKTALNTVVKINLEKDPDFVEANKEKVQTFERQSCLSNCSGNGVCTQEGVCDCNEGFSGSDCTISKTSKLNVFGVEGNGICDLQHGDDCERFELYTFDLTEGFVCQIIEHQVLINGSKIELQPIVEEGVFIDNYNGECFISAMRRKRSVGKSEVVIGKTYDVYISNDGKTLSNRVPLIVLDSHCQDVTIDSNGDAIFVLKDGTCFINGRCYSSNDHNVYESCEKCYPEQNPFQWTKGCIKTPQGVSNVNVLAIVLGTVVPVALILFVTGVICYVQKLYGKQKRCVTPKNNKFEGI